MGVDHRTFSLCPGILNLETNATPIPDFQLGPASRTDVHSRPAELTVEYTVGDVDSFDGGTKGIRVRDGRIQYQKNLGVLGDLKCEIRAEQKFARLKVNRRYHRLGRLSIGTVPSVGEILEDLVSIQLLRNGYAMLYCGGVSHRGETTVFIGLTNSGKTTTVLNLVEREGVQYIAEDIAVTDGSRLYCCPFALSPVDPDILRSDPQPLRDWISANIPLLSSVSVRSLDSVYDVLAEDQVDLSGEVSRVTVLSRNQHPESGPDASRLMALANRGEFTYMTNQILLGAQYLGYELDIDSAMAAERDIMNDLVADSAVSYFAGDRKSVYRDVKREVLRA